MKTNTQKQICNSTIYQKVQKIITDMDIINVAPHNITPNASFLHDLGFDSLDMFDLLDTVEHEFKIKIPASKYGSNNIKTVNDLVKIIQKQLYPKQTFLALVMTKITQKTK